MSWNKRQPPTIDDLKTRLCWICREEETVGDAQAAATPTKEWLHPCSCTLVCHAECLLTWIEESRKQKRDSGPLKCPQCSTPFEIVATNPPPLKFLESIDRVLSRVGEYTSICVLGGGVVVCASAIVVVLSLYGEYALKTFVGAEAAAFILGGDIDRWSWLSWFNLPLIPVGLILSRHHAYAIPFTFPSFLLFPPPTHASGIQNLGYNLKSNFLSYPPSPPLLLAVFPFIRPLYIMGMNALARRIFGPSLALPGPASDIQRPAQRRVFVLEHQNAEIIAEVDRAGAPQGAAGNDEAAPETVRITGAMLGRLVGSSLMLPAISQWMGDALFRLSSHSNFLRQFLGIPKPSPIRLLRSPVAATLGFGLWGWEEFDPVWWRNAVGLSLFFIAKDAIGYYHLWLRQRERRSRKVMNRTFEGVDLTGLEWIS